MAMVVQCRQLRRTSLNLSGRDNLAFLQHLGKSTEPADVVLLGGVAGKVEGKFVPRQLALPMEQRRHSERTTLPRSVKDQFTITARRRAGFSQGAFQRLQRCAIRRLPRHG